MHTNIDKGEFNRLFDEYLRQDDEQVIAWYYTKRIHKSVLTIIHNVTYSFDFNTEQLLYEDVEADLLLHLWLKRESLKRYQGNWYNIIFTMFKRKFYDILRSYKNSNDRLIALIEMSLDQDHNSYELEDPEQPAQEVPAVLPEQRVEAVQGAEATGRTLVPILRGKGRADTSKRSRPHNPDQYGLQLAFGF